MNPTNKSMHDRLKDPDLAMRLHQFEVVCKVAIQLQQPGQS